MNTIKENMAIEYCEKSAKNYRALGEKCLNSIGRGESEVSSLGGGAYFLQEAEMYEYEIPNIIMYLLSLDKGPM